MVLIGETFERDNSLSNSFLKLFFENLLIHHQIHSYYVGELTALW